MPTEITFANDAASLPALPVGVADAIGAAIASASDAASSAEAALASQNIAKYNADSAAASVVAAAATILTYYGPMASDPSTRPGGAASVTGDLYYNTTTFKLRIYSGTAWADAAASTLGSAAYKNTGTTGDAIPLLNMVNTWTANQGISPPSGNAFQTINAIAGQQAGINLSQGGPTKWQIIKQADGSFLIYDAVGGVGVVSAATGVHTTLNGLGGILNLQSAGVTKAIVDANGQRLIANAYLGWGASSGSGGYGLRDNAGVIELKNSGGAWAPIPTSVALRFAVRQTASAGPVDAGGLPSLLPATSASLSITTQNVTSTAPLVVTAAQGFGGSRQVDYASQFTANQTWSSLTANSTLFLYVNAQTGALGSTALAPIYQNGGTPSTAAGQFTFKVSQMIGYMGNGTTAPATPIVFVGEVVTNATTVTSAVAYAYNGDYDSGWTNTLPAVNVGTTRSANLGLKPRSARLVLECLTTEGGYAVGDQMESPYTSDGTGTAPVQIWSTRTTIGFQTGANTAFRAVNRSGGAAFALTAANWRFKLLASRGW